MEKGNADNKSFPEAAVEVFKESLLTGVPNILSEKRIAMKSIKIISFLLCTFWFTYQLFQFTTVYFKYPTEKDTEVLYSDITYTGLHIPFLKPALIICNANPVKRERFCSHEPEVCYTPNDEKKFCEDHSYYCKMSKLPANFSVGTFPRTKLEDLLPFGQKADELIVEVTSDNRNILTSNSEDMYAHFDVDAERWLPCYTLDYHADNDKYPYKFDAKGETMYDMAVNLVTINFDAANTVNLDILPGGFLGVGSPFEPILPKFRMKTGMKYTIKVNLKEEERLPYPYDTNCRNYSDEWLKNNKTGPRSREMCIHSCLRRKARNSFCKPCTSRYLYKGGVFPIKQMCNSTCEPYRDRTNPDSDVYMDKEKCLTICKDACLKYRFFYSVDKVVPVEWSDSVSEIEIKLQDPPVKTVSYRPRYEPVELFSYIGGYMGLWLGFSAIAMIDFVISFIFILWMAVKRSLRRSVSTIKKTIFPIPEDTHEKKHSKTRI